MDLNTKNYANMKRSTCQARARNLRYLVQSSPASDSGNGYVRYVVFSALMTLLVLTWKDAWPKEPLCRRLCVIRFIFIVTQL